MTLNSYFWIKYDRGTFKGLFNKIIGMFITRLKKNTLQGVSTTMAKGVGQVTSRKVMDSIIVKYPKDNITYQQHMGGVYCGYQHSLMGEVFVNLSHLKTCYKKELGDCLF